MPRFVVEVKETRTHRCVIDCASAEEAEELAMEDHDLYSVDDQFDEVVLIGVYEDD